MSTSDRILAQADELLRRVSPAARDLARRQRRRRQQAFMRRLRKAVIYAIAIVLGMAILGVFMRNFGVPWIMLTLLVTFLVAIAVLISGGEPEPTAERLMESDLAALPAKTEEWLAQQRPALPAPANRTLDKIAVRLEELRPQLEGLDPREPAAVEVRRLVGVELPELVEGYQRVPDHLRRDTARGQSPQDQLVDGLGIVESEIDRMTRQLASGELDALATQGKFLELKYRGDEDLGEG